MELRPYQLEAIERTARLLNQTYRPLIVAPTSSGKSVIQAGICARAAAKGHRVLALCHQGEILDQNERTINELAPAVKTAVYCAGQGRKETDGQVFFASRDSLGNNPSALGEFTLVIVDEAHLISMKKDTRYHKIFSAVQAKWIVGLTGTPWRLDGGQIWGKNAFFERISYNISLDFLVGQGFIVPYTFPKIQSLVDTTKLKISKLTGDYDEEDLSKASTSEEIVSDAVAIWKMYAAERKCSIFFCCSIAHAKLVAQTLRSVTDDQIAYVDGTTTDDVRDLIFERARKGLYRAIVNVGVLTTGVDIKPIDCVVMLRATRSASLFVQCCGRGLRTNPGKENLLIIDLAGNFERFGSLSTPLLEPVTAKVEDEEKEKLSVGFDLEKNGKECPQCSYRSHPATKVCPYCKHIFITHGVNPFAGQKQTQGEHEVELYDWHYSNTKAGEKCVIATWKLKGSRKKLKEWLLYERQTGHGRLAQAKLSLLLSKRITRVIVSDLAEKFPNIRYTGFSNETPIRASTENAGIRFA